MGLPGYRHSRTLVPDSISRSVGSSGCNSWRPKDAEISYFSTRLCLHTCACGMHGAHETMGPINAARLNFISDLGRHLTLATGEQRETTYLFQRLSITMQRLIINYYYYFWRNKADVTSPDDVIATSLNDAEKIINWYNNNNSNNNNNNNDNNNNDNLYGAVMQPWCFKSAWVVSLEILFTPLYVWY